MESRSGDTAERGVRGLEDTWQRLGEEGKADDLGILESSIRMIWEADARGSSWVSGTAGFVTVPALGVSMEDCVGGVSVFGFIRMFCVNISSEVGGLVAVESGVQVFRTLNFGEVLQLSSVRNGDTVPVSGELMGDVEKGSNY